MEISVFEVGHDGFLKDFEQVILGVSHDLVNLGSCLASVLKDGQIVFKPGHFRIETRTDAYSNPDRWF